MTGSSASAVLCPGPWQHRFVAANGSRFHLAEAGEGPLVVLLHGYEQFWFAWHRQLQALAAAGYRAVALDLRGYGGSDRPPNGYDTPTLAADVAGVIRSLGHGDAVIVGHGLGAWLAWSMPHLQPAVTRAVGALGLAHPALTVRTAPMAVLRTGRPGRTLAGLVDGRPRTTASPVPPRVAELRRWSSPRSAWPAPDDLEQYRRVADQPFAARSGAETRSWLLGAPLHPSGRRVLAAVCRPVEVPVLQLHGADDRLVRAASARRSAEFVRAEHTWQLVPRAGHFVHEEQPAATSRALTAWLRGLRRRSAPCPPDAGSQTSRPTAPDAARRG